MKIIFAQRLVRLLVSGCAGCYRRAPQLLLVAVAVLSAVLGEVRDAIAVLSHRHAGRFSSLAAISAGARPRWRDRAQKPVSAAAPRAAMSSVAPIAPCGGASA